MTGKDIAIPVPDKCEPDHATNIQKAAEMRAQGDTWAQVAIALEYKGASSACTSLMRRYPAYWTALMLRETDKYLVGDARTKAMRLQVDLIDAGYEEEEDKFGRRTLTKDVGRLRLAQTGAAKVLDHVAALEGKKVQLTVKRGVDDIADHELIESAANFSNRAANTPESLGECGVALPAIEGSVGEPGPAEGAEGTGEA